MDVSKILICTFLVLAMTLLALSNTGQIFASQVNNTNATIGTMNLSISLSNGTQLLQGLTLPIVECPGGDDDGVWCLGL
jgi:hypothetical protein